MVRTDGVADVGLLFVLLADLHSEDGVRQFGLVVGHLADVVQQSGAACLLRVQAQLRGHDGAEVGCLAGMLEEVLAVRRTVFHLPD